MSGTLTDSPASTWTANEVNAIQTTDVAQGQGTGAGFNGLGSLNAGAQKLANRTAFLNNAINAEAARAKGAEALLAPLNSPAFSGAPTTPTPSASDNSGKVPNTNWLYTCMSYVAAAAGFAISLGTPGFVKLPSWLGGFIIQWGNHTSGGYEVCYFPLAFPTAVLAVVVSESAANSSTWGASRPTLHGSSPNDRTGFWHWTMYWNGGGWSYGSASAFWIAVGY